MRQLIAACAIVASFVATDAYDLHSTKAAQAPWQLSKAQAPVDMNQKIQMSVGLKRKNVELLEKILLEVSDPKAAKYGEHMNNEQMRALISPGADAVEAVKSWLAINGISNVEVATHEDSMKFEATRAQISALLKVQWANYDNTKSEQTSVRALGATEVPEHLKDIIQMVAGHRGWPIPKKTGPKVATKKADFGVSVTPKVIYTVYNETDIPTTPAGKKNIQSFFQAQGQYVEQSDLSSFCGTYLPNVTGGASCKISKYIGGTDGKAAGIESSLDSQYITATSFGAETWVYTYSGNDFCSDLLSWSQDVFAEKNSTFPNVISMSYGSQHLPTYCDGKGAHRLSEDTMKMGAMGISVMIASGDEGSGQFARAGWNWGYLSPSFPSEMPYVTAVGSTTFEGVSNSGPQRAASFSGGGFSYTWSAPSYQQAAIKHFLNTTSHIPKAKYNTTGRATPDVSFLGDAFNIVSGGQTEQVGGTSCSTPSFSGMVTLLNNIRLKNGKTLGFLNPMLYSTGADGFTDITTGDNDMLHDNQGWYAEAGWDPVTGLGTPNFNKLASIVKGINEAENARKL